MSKKLKLLIILVLTVVVLSACGKDESDIAADIETPERPPVYTVVDVTEYLPEYYNSYDVNTTLTEDEKLQLVNSFCEKTPISAMVYMNGSLSRGDFFTVSRDTDPDTLKAIQNVAFSGDVQYESLGALENIGYYGYAYYITYTMDDGSKYTFFHNLYEENNMIGYDGCWFYPDVPIDNYVFSAVYDAYKRYGEEGKVQNVHEITGDYLIGGPTRIFTPLQIDSCIPYTDMTTDEKKAFLEGFDTNIVESAFVFLHGGVYAGISYEVYRDGDEAQLQMLLDYAFSSGEFVPVREYLDGYAYEYYIIFKCTDGQEYTLFFHNNGNMVRFDGQSFKVEGMILEMFSDAPVYKVQK